MMAVGSNHWYGTNLFGSRSNPSGGSSCPPVVATEIVAAMSAGWAIRELVPFTKIPVGAFVDDEDGDRDILGEATALGPPLVA